MGGSAHFEGAAQSQGPQHFSMDCQVEGGPMLTTNKQGQTANELLNWFEKSWKGKVAKSPHAWTVLAVNVHGNSDYLQAAQDDIRREEEIRRAENEKNFRRDLQAQEDADLRAQVSRGNIEETNQSMRDYVFSRKSGDELLAEAQSNAAKQKTLRLALQQALAQDNFDILLEAQSNFQEITNPDMASDRLLSTANLRISILQELKRAEAKLERARERLENISSRFPNLDPNVLPVGFTRTSSLLTVMTAVHKWFDGVTGQAQKALPDVSSGPDLLILADEGSQASSSTEGVCTTIPREVTHAINDFEKAKKAYDQVDVDVTSHQRNLSRTDVLFSSQSARQVFELEIKYNARGKQNLGGMDELQFDPKGRRVVHDGACADFHVQEASRDLVMLADEGAKASGSTENVSPTPGVDAAWKDPVRAAASTVTSFRALMPW